MKICTACSEELPKEKFSKKQWQSKQHQRRCKECIADNREVKSEAPANDDEVPLPCAGGETDEDIFKEPSPRDECPICCLPLPIVTELQRYQSCCGKMLCIGCIRAVLGGDNRCLCPYCRAPAPKSEGESIERVKKRAEADDANAIFSLGCFYDSGEKGLPQDCNKALELWLRAGELGSVEANNNVATAYLNGRGVERDTEKAKYYWELAAIGGDPEARHNLGVQEENAGNMDRAMRHWMIAAGAGLDASLRAIQNCYFYTDATKDDFVKALRTHKAAKNAMKSDQREAASDQSESSDVVLMREIWLSVE